MTDRNARVWEQWEDPFALYIRNLSKRPAFNDRRVLTSKGITSKVLVSISSRKSDLILHVHVTICIEIKVMRQNTKTEPHHHFIYFFIATLVSFLVFSELTIS